MVTGLTRAMDVQTKISFFSTILIDLFFAF